MKYTVGCDAHRRFSQFAIFDERGQLLKQARVDHHPGAIRNFLAQLPYETPVALKTVGNWYWIVEEIEEAGCIPFLAHAAKAKVMMGNVNKTDKLDAKGLATLLHNGTLPTVWLPPGETRDERELHRTRMALTKLRTALKNRIRSTLSKYALNTHEHSDIFVGKGKGWLETTIPRLPPQTARCLTQQLQTLDVLQEQIDLLEDRIQQRIEHTPNMQHLKTLPGVADILSIVIEQEVGSIDRFASAGHLASYAGLVPRVHASAGKFRYGHMRKQANRYLKWAFIEAANVVVRHRNHPTWRIKKVSRIYERIRRRKGHSIAVGAVARHLAESAFWVLKKGEAYREPAIRRQASPNQAQLRA